MNTNSPVPITKTNAIFPRLRGSFLQNWDDLWTDFDDLWVDSWFNPSPIRKAFSSLDVTEENYSLKIELPGVDPSEIEVERKGDTLRIKAEQNDKKKKRYFSFEKMITLPESVDSDKIVADLKSGVLTILIPKVQPKELPEAEAVKIDVKS